MILLKLILAHLLGDFLLQPKSWVEEKEKRKVNSLWLYLHLAIHAVVSLIILGNPAYWPLVLLVVISHLIIDIVKLSWQTEKTKVIWFIIDQLLHLLAITSIYFLYMNPSIDLTKLLLPQSWIYATALLLLTSVSGITIQNLLANWSKKLDDGNNTSLKNAGKYIGILERLFVFLFVVTSNWEPIGYLLAAKSIFRFGDLKKSKDRKLTEYILIGTLLSFAIAMGIGLVVVSLNNYYK